MDHKPSIFDVQPYLLTGGGWLRLNEWVVSIAKDGGVTASRWAIYIFFCLVSFCFVLFCFLV